MRNINSAPEERILKRRETDVFYSEKNTMVPLKRKVWMNPLISGWQITEEGQVFTVSRSQLSYGNKNIIHEGSLENFWVYSLEDDVWIEWRQVMNMLNCVRSVVRHWLPQNKTWAHTPSGQGFRIKSPTKEPGTEHGCQNTTNRSLCLKLRL